MLGIQRGERFRFTLEAGHTLGVGRERVGQNLDRDVPIERRVARAIHFAHPARANQRDDLIRPDSRSRRQHVNRPIA